jgi:hypothetical protein
MDPHDVAGTPEPSRLELVGRHRQRARAQDFEDDITSDDGHGALAVRTRNDESAGGAKEVLRGVQS